MSDLTWGLLRHGYDAVALDRLHRGGGVDYRSRLLGHRALVVCSHEGVRAFYDEAIVERSGAIPPPLAWLLFGRGAVHALDDTAHRDRKTLFLQVLSPSGLAPLVAQAERLLREATAGWPDRGEVSLFDELVTAYGRAVLDWAGLRLAPAEAVAWSRRLAAIVDGFGFAGTAYARAWRARQLCNRWAERLVHDVRTGEVKVDARAPLAILAAAEDLDDRTAGVELLNLLRPTVAVAWLGTFAAARVADSPEWLDRLRASDEAAGLAFAQEVRRTTPFAPALAGRVRSRADVGGHVVQPGQRMVLDIIGVHQDPARYPEPEAFRPERFLGQQPDPYDLVPQGGGHPSGHRCPGEDLALLLLQATVRVLAETAYDVRDDGADRSRIPTLPAHGLGVRAQRSGSGRARVTG